MNSALIEKCDLLIKNRNTLRELFPFAMDGDSTILAGSSFYVGCGKEPDPDKIQACRDLVKKESLIFSAFRGGHASVPLLCKMAASEDPERYFADLHTIMDQMKDMSWINADYKVLAAMTIADHAEPSEYPHAVEKMEALYQGMKENHRWLTSGEDIPFAAMLAVSNLDTDALLTEMENCFTELKEQFHDKNAVQTLSHVLAADKTAAGEKCEKVKKIWDLLKEKDHKYGESHELAVLGTLSMLDLPLETIADEIIEADEYLKKQTGFGNLTMGTKTRRMYAALLVMDTHVSPASRSHESLLDSMITVVISMEICMIVMMTSIMVTTAIGHQIR